MTGIGAEDFAAWMKALLPAPPPRLAVAVSGGADSMALALLAKHWADAQGIALAALTVDHRLRPESAGEARQVAAWMAQHGIAHHTLVWEHDAAPTRNRQAAARAARYALIAAWCREQGIAHLLLGHHLDDQAETVLIRLQRGSGVDGLAAMRPVTHRHGLTLLRPLLEASKSALEETLHAKGQAWVQDPSNDNPHYTRSRMRALMAEAGIDSRGLADTAQRMARARDYLEQQTTRAAAECVTWHSEGYAELDMAAFSALHPEIALRLLADILRVMNADAYRPRFQELEGLYHALPDARTLAGCQFVPASSGSIRIQREIAALAAPVALRGGDSGIWDGRFAYAASPDCPPMQLRALGADGWAMLREAAPEWTKRITLPKAILHALPCLWHLEMPALVPHIQYNRQGAGAGWVHFHTFPLRNGS